MNLEDTLLFSLMVSYNLTGKGIIGKLPSCLFTLIEAYFLMNFRLFIYLRVLKKRNSS